MADIEKLIRDRSRVILMMGLSFVLWQGGHIATRLLATDSSWLLYASIAYVIGAITYAISTISLVMYQMRVQKSGAACTLNDDWAKHIRALAAQYGFVFSMFATVLMYAATLFWELPAVALLQGLIMIGVSATLLAYVWLERKGEAGQ